MTAMNNQDWLQRWHQGKTGWHQQHGNAALRAHWSARGSRVLVPLCGKTPDLRWLAQRGHQVTGIELSELAIEDFFVEQALGFECEIAGRLKHYRCRELPISIYQGDYFDFKAPVFDALYDRGAMVALSPPERQRYVAHTQSLLQAGAEILLIALVYDQAVVEGPPFSLPGDQLGQYWPDLQQVEERDSLDNCPPRFLAAGLERFTEVIWKSPATEP